jgi:predicted CXXCH cytochrome family protein
VNVLIRETSQTASGTTVHDREFGGGELAFGSAPDCAIHIVGRGVERRHGLLEPLRDGLRLRCAGRARVLVNGAPVRTATLRPGELFELAGSTVRVEAPPPGFDAAVTVTPARNVSPGDLEGAYVTALDQTWLSRRRPAWLLATALLLFGLIVPWLVPAEHLPWILSDRIWSSGPLHPAHGVAIADDCSACHVKPFQRVQDTQCLACHQQVTDHAAADLAAHVGLDSRRCASCHKEHHTPRHLIITADALCTDCHAAPDWPDNRLASVRGFTLATHPPFSADLLVSRTELRGTGFAYEWLPISTPVADAVEQSNLKFPHDVHLDAARVQTMDTGTPLVCADCHQLQLDDEHFEPISMERHCRACHDLKFDRTAPDRELPHGNPVEVLLTMEGHFMRLYADPEVGEPARPRRRLPDSRGGDDADACEGPAYLCARERTAREAETQFTRRGCVTCHEVATHDTTDLLGRYQVVPVRLTPDFFTAARFNHRKHLTQHGASGDAACLSCHDATASSSSSDVLIPDIDNCVTCHGDYRQRGLVTLNCIDCHAFHPRVHRSGVGGSAE